MSTRHLLVALAFVAASLAGCVLYLRPQCTDLIRNGHETDVDCGGTCPASCALGRSCDGDDDCESGTCRGGRCEPPPCANGALDGDETDVDCGGGTCRRCPGGRRCLADGDCFGSVCDPGSSTCSSLRNVAFASGVSYPAGNKTYALFAGDLDADGSLDLVAANEVEDSLSVFLGAGDGTFGRAGPNVLLGECGAAGCYPTGGAVADLDRDGRPDVVTANYHGNSVTVSLGIGDGTFRPPVSYPTEPGAETSNLAVGDLNGDTYPDVVATNPNTGSASLFLGRADGTLDAAVRLPVGSLSSGPFSAAIGDFDGDSRQDLAVADMSGRAIVVRLGNGDGTLGTETALPEGGIPAYICVTQDMDVDGRLDVVCANRGSDDVSVLLGRGDGTFSFPVVSSTGIGTGPYALAVADFNLDGVPDIVTPNYVTGTASVLLGIGDGRFDLPRDAGPTGEFTYGVVTGDFDRDGRPDFAVCNAVSNDVVVKLNTSN